LTKPFSIYRSSAGSGKTRTLAKEYLKLALQHRGSYFRHILAVTFTNKSTQEMKDRILAYLNDFANGNPNELAEELKTELKLDANTFQERSQDVQRQILHHYSQFAISTIDAFFQKVIRSFTRESGLMGDYTLEVDQDAVLEEVINELIDELGTNKELTEWVVEFAKDNLENERAWDVRSSLRAFAQQIFREEFKVIEDDILKETNDHLFFQELKKNLQQTKAIFLNQVSKPAAEALQIIRDKGWEYAELYYGERSGLFTFFRMFAEEKNLAKFSEPGNRIKNDFTKAEKWPGKKTTRAAEIIQTADEKLVPIIQQLLDTYEKQFTQALSAELVLKNMYVFGLIADISRKLKEYKQRNNMMLLADAPKFLNGIIADSDTPFIYEKVGSFYKNFLIDEFQDTSGFQWKNFLPLLTNSLDQGNRNIVVGDVKQAIYRWRGGDLNLLQQQVENQIGKERVNVLELDTNYRSASTIVHFNNTVFQQASQHVKAITEADLPEAAFTDVAQKDFKKHTGFVQLQFIQDDDPQEYAESQSESQEEKAGWREIALNRIPKQLEELQAMGVNLTDIAILVRKNSEGQKIAAHLLQYKNSDQARPDCKYDVISNESLRIDGAATVNLMLAALRNLYMPEDLIARAQLSYEYTRMHESQRSLTDVFKIGDQKVFEATLPDAFTKSKAWLKRLPLFELTETLIDIFKLGTVSGELEYLQAFQGLVLEFYTRQRNDVGAFLEWWENNKHRKSLQISGEVDAVQIVTMHKSKGLQFKYVLIPFCSWNMDHDHFNSPLLWVQSDKKPFADSGYFPVEYASRLKESYFEAQYREETVRSYLDNLNLLYVAFTRAEHALMVSAPHPNNRNQRGYSVSKLLFESIATSETLNPHWDDATAKFTIGELTAVKHEKKKASNAVTLHEYQASRWRDKLVIKHQALAYYDHGHDQQQRIQYGIHMHTVLSRIHYQTQIPEVLTQIVLEGLITEDEKQPLHDQLTELLRDPKIATWFSETWTVRTEVPIILPDGEESRVDRLMLKGTQAIVVDFKTGESGKHDVQQVSAYINILRQMNFTDVQGFILYLKDRSVVDVNNIKPNTSKQKNRKDQLGLF
jgi:ATP-dependent helicase/nuclease subunit A